MTSDEDLEAALAASAFEKRPDPPLGCPEMARFLASEGFEENVVPNDNDCLFRAVQIQLLKQGINVGPIEELRAMSADWINEHREKLEMHMAGERPFDETEGLCIESQLQKEGLCVEKKSRQGQ